MQLSLFGETRLRALRGVVEADGDEHRRGTRSSCTGEVRGVNFHAGVFVHKCDREGLEHLAHEL